MKNATIWIALALLFAAAGASAATLSVASTSATCGSQTSVAVNIDNASGLLSVEFRIAYDTSVLTVTNVTTGTVTSGFSSSYNATGGVVRVAMASGSPSSGAGSVAVITMSVGPTATGTSALTISNVLLNDVASGGNSGSVTITCPRPPDPPTYVSPANGATGVTPPVTLVWNAAGGATSYNVYFGTSSSPPFLTSTGGTSQAVQVATGTQYYWSVESVNLDGIRSGGVSTFTTGGPPPCAAPGTPTASVPSAAVSGQAYDVTWGAVATASEYRVEESTSSAFTSPTGSTIAAPATKATFTHSVPDDTTYYYRVRARRVSTDCNMESGFSATVSTTVRAEPPLCEGCTVLPVVGSTPGAAGSFFKTAMQLHNASDVTISGKLVYHPQGSSGSENDPSIAYTLRPGQSRYYPDLLPAMGQSGLGTLDLVSTSGDLPLTVARIFNDAGAAGTTGMTADQAGLDLILLKGDRAILIAPPEPARARFNIGVRTLNAGAAMTIVIRNKEGDVLRTLDKSYPPTFFEQVPSATMLGVTLGESDAIYFTITSGSAVIYGATTDNTTQDPALQFARPPR